MVSSLYRPVSGSVAPMTDLLVDALAVHRLTRLIVTDSIGDRPRAHVMRALKAGGYEKAMDGLRCEWCSAVWVTAAVTVARVVAPRAWRRTARFLALADLSGIITSHT